MDIILSLLLLSSSLLLLNVAGDSPCSEGFMDYSLLESKAGDIGVSHSIPSNIAKGEPSKWIIQDNNNKFDCSDTMTLTGVLIGVDIRTETSTRNKYPSIEIWRQEDNNYVKYDPEKSFTIKLSPDNFTTSGLYRYSLSPPLSMNRHDRLVLYQPSNAESVVRFYTVTSNSNEDQIGRFADTDDDEIRVKSMDDMEATVSWTTLTKVLLQPILDNANCYSIDESFDADRLSLTNLKLVSDVRVFPSIKFTCHGIITNWIIGTTANSHPVIMIRHSDNTTTNAVSINTETISPIDSNVNVYNITVTNEVRVQPGDILMINSTGTEMYYQQYNGPFNYILGPALTRMESNDYPLISAIISSTTSLMSSDMFMSTSSNSKSTSEVISKSTTIIMITASTTQTAHQTQSSSLSTLINQTAVTITPTTIPTSNLHITPTIVPISNFTSTAIVPSSSTSNEPNLPPTSTVPIFLTTSIPNPSSDITLSSQLMTISESFASTIISNTTTTKSITTTHMKEPTITLVHTSVLLQTTEAIGSTTIVHSLSNNSATPPTTIITNRPSTATLSPTVQGGGTTDHTFMIVLSVVGAVFILLAVSILAVLIVSVLVCRRRKRLILEIPREGINSSHLNPVYSLSSITPKEEEKLGHSNPSYQIQTLQGEQLYSELEAPVMNGICSDAIADGSVTSITNPYYDISITKKKGDPLVRDEPEVKSKRKQEVNVKEMYSLLEDVILYVPAPAANERNVENTYATLINDQQSVYSRLDHTGSNAFFIEDTEYWEPDSNTDGIYQQLSDRKYREIIRHQIKVTDYLGSGQFGTVHKGVWTTPTAGSVSVAIKTLNDNTSEDERVKFLQEAAIMGQFHHPNVVKLHGVVTIGHPAMIVLELIAGGDLQEYLNKFKSFPGELVLSSVSSILLSFCRQIASGMEYLSRKKFVHRDLAARNILVSDEGTGICKIADFGMSRDLQDESYYISQSKKIPIKWTAPEALHYKKYSSTSDVWSYGAVMYEIWSIGHKPFEMYTNQEYVRLVDSGYRLPPPPGCPKPMYKLMMQCWNPDTHNRPSFSDISSSLSSPDKQLLMINEEDPVTVLGAALEASYSLYNDLQYMYMRV